MMTRFRLAPFFRSTNFTRPSPHSTLHPLNASRRRPYAGSNYGGGEGDPKGENPQDQGSNPSAELEHPGPPPPDVGKGSGGGPTKAGAQGHNTQQNASSRGQGSSGGDAENKGGPQPKIHKHSPPADEHHTDDVKKHNEEMKTRHDRPQEKSPDEEDKVDKGFWSGQYPLRSLKSGTDIC